ncbi:conserved hypothetical protein (plasmid) [Sphingobium indicum UT26S]|uniref:Uncharacterized protein n=1 Tax=Sphingobium indicum (strain DSM 16413 / CCM 7287 / MTCC 6362 / UT26 / NBRC 101211 / UT26S) TaxID=452662 RepID=D4Z8V7_SPHIU|nr:conserved hypothetical protein [Sphingobium indicum UT26S]
MTPTTGRWSVSSKCSDPPMRRRLPRYGATPSGRTGSGSSSCSLRVCRSQKVRFYGIRSVDEARTYLDHPVLGTRYRDCVTALQDLPISDPVAVFGAIDAMKLRSSLTLFEAVQPSALLASALDRWFGGERDAETLQLLGAD